MAGPVLSDWRRVCAALCLASLFTLSSGDGRAHFLELLPSTDDVDQTSGREVGLALTFTHPFETGPVMQLLQPVSFGVLVGGTERHDLAPLLTAVRRGEGQGFFAAYRVRRPGAHIFHVSPQPYWEPGEGKWIVHYTKVVVPAYGSGEGWAAPVGLPVEIRPLTRPFGLWSGNLFQGIVLQNGVPAPFATVEVELHNAPYGLVAPTDFHVTQVITADGDGVFSYAIPHTGWWGFAALLEAADPRPSPDGAPAPVELGALIWVYAHDIGGASVPATDGPAAEKE